MNTKANFFILAALVTFAGQAFGADAPTSPTQPPAAPLTSPPTAENPEKDTQGAKWEEVQNIIDDIKTQNPPDNIKLRIRVGTVQTITNNQGSTDGVQLGQAGSMVGFGLDGDFNILGNFGIEARETYTQNLLPTVGSVNLSTTYLSWFDAGPTYTFFLDSTHLDNTVVAKLLYHENYNNVLLNPGSETFLWVNYYSGVSASLERNIPITNKLGIMGSFDLLQILNTSTPTLNESQSASPTRNTIAKSGYGFEIHAEIYYKINWGKRPMRIGVMYWQQGNQSELDNSIKSTQGRNSYFQASRAIFGTAQFLF